MKIQPTVAYVTLFDENYHNPVGGDKVEFILQCCDSVIAVLDNDAFAEWMVMAAEYVEDPEASEYTDGFATLVFDVDGQQLVMVADTGGEWLSGVFAEFCEGGGIEFQGIVDSPDVTDVPVEDIYTGSGDDRPELLRLLHKIYN